MALQRPWLENERYCTPQYIYSIECMIRLMQSKTIIKDNAYPD